MQLEARQHEVPRTTMGREVSRALDLGMEAPKGKFTFKDCNAFARGLERANRRGLHLPDARAQGQTKKERVSAAASSRLLRGMQLVPPPPEYQLYSRPVGTSDLDKVIPLGDRNYALRGGAPGNFRSSAPALHRVVDTEAAEALWPQTAKMNVRWEGHHIDHGKDDPTHEFVREWTHLSKAERSEHWSAGPYSTLPKTQDLRTSATEGRRDLEGPWQPTRLFDSEENLARFGRLGQFARDLHSRLDVRKQRGMAGSASAPALPLRGDHQIRQDRPVAKPAARGAAMGLSAPSKTAVGPGLLRGGTQGGAMPAKAGEALPGRTGHERCVEGSANRPFAEGGPLLYGQQNTFARKTDFYTDYDLYTRPLDSSQLDKVLPMGVRCMSGTVGAPWDGLTQNMPRTKP